MGARSRFALIVATWALGAIVAVVGAVQSRYILSTVDGISYLSIARQYAEGHVDAAINAYWSPWVSWLSAPFIAAGIGEILALDLVTAGAVIVASALFARIVWMRAGRNVILTVIALGTFYVFALGNLSLLTPDMLVVTWMILWVSILVEVDERLGTASMRGRIVMGLVLGVAGTLGYFTKVYLVPVFLVTLLAWFIARSLAARAGARRALVSSLLPIIGAAALTVVLTAAPWVGALSVTYQTLTIGSSIGVNVEAKFDPDAADAPVGPMVLNAPPNEYAVAYGEDRTGEISSAVPSSASTPSLAQRVSYYLSQRIEAFPYYLVRIGSIAPFAALTAAVVFFVLIFGGRFRGRRELALIGVTWGVYFLGYAAVTSPSSRGGNARYYWPLLVLALLMAAILIPEVWRRYVAGRGRGRAIAAILAFALIPAGAIWQHGAGEGAPFSSETPLSGVGYLFKKAQPMREATFAAESLAPLIPEGSKIVGSNYRAALRYAYYLHAQIYGRSAQGYRLDDPAFQSLMRDAGISYYLRFTPAAEEPAAIGGAGQVVGTFTEQVTCADEKRAIVEACVIDVIRVGS
ncbi:hypothetical protein BH09ACT4_BH09ACT4_01550 [soil metagenome]